MKVVLWVLLTTCLGDLQNLGLVLVRGSSWPLGPPKDGEDGEWFPAYYPV